jgi:23S rRNA (uracil1939-C5)-methyltransferase
MLTKPRLGQRVKVTIERLGIYGEGVGYSYGYTLFIDGALPGEELRARVHESHKNYGRAHIVKTISASPHRVAPVCPLFGKCGGCQIMHLAYPQQLESKQKRVDDALQRIGKFTGVEVAACEPSPSQLAYRNKIQLPVSPGENGMRLGLYAHDSHDLVEIERCKIHCALGEEAYAHLLRILKDSKLTAYDPKTGEGDLRHVIIKTAVFTSQILIVLVTTQIDSPALNSVARKLLGAMPAIKGVVQNINTASGNSVLGSEYRTLAGEPVIEEKLCGLFFKVSPASFFQVNPEQAEKLYERVLALAALTGTERVLDAYCGVGTLSLILAKQAKEVVGVECVAEAIVDAKENAKRNALTNVTFECAEAETFIQTLQQTDVAILNPPRRGCEPSFLERLVVLQPKRIVYVSCDPATLARDLAYLAANGYKIEVVQPFDMFPQTAHVECVVSLSFLPRF